MAIAISTCALPEGAWSAELTVKHTFINVSKAPCLKRVKSDSEICYCDYGSPIVTKVSKAHSHKRVNSDSSISLADAETASEVTDSLTDDDSFAWIETASAVTELDFDDDSFAWMETSSTVTELDFDDVWPSSSFSSVPAPCEMDAVNATHLDMQVAQPQMATEAQDTEEGAQFARQAALLNAQVQEAEAVAWLAQCKAQQLYVQLNTPQPNCEISQTTIPTDITQQVVPVHPIASDCSQQMVWMPVFSSACPSATPTCACPSAIAPSPECIDVSSAHYTTVQQLQANGGATPMQEFTTLMLRNIPNSYTRDMLVELLDKEGFWGHYDLVYVPVDFSRLAGLGYAFVNFSSNEAAEKASQTFQGFRGWNNTSLKVCEVKWSGPLQGLSTHIEHYRNSPVMHDSVPECFKPALFQGGLRQPFPRSTKELRAPRVKRAGGSHTK